VFNGTIASINFKILQWKSFYVLTYKLPFIFELSNDCAIISVGEAVEN
jgi:hypothetical protein